MENASSSSTVQWKYDVFISFRGEDTRNNFMDHLYNTLRVKGINTFRDDEKLEKGEPISRELLKAIEESRFTVVILSKDYASSPWCLDELVKIIACKEKNMEEEDMRMIVLPVFHYVEPSDVRKQMGTFAQAFVKHEEKEEKTRVDKWRYALRQVGNLAGWHLKDTRQSSWLLCVVNRDEFRSPRSVKLSTALRVAEMVDAFVEDAKRQPNRLLYSINEDEFTHPRSDELSMELRVAAIVDALVEDAKRCEELEEGLKKIVHCYETKPN